MVISVIIPVWNKSGLTDAFFRQHAALYVGAHNIEFVVVDNGSTDDTAAVLNKWRSYFRRFKVISLDKNHGFGGGNNIGAKNADGDIFIFTQNDVRAMGDYVGKLVQKMHEYNTRRLYGAQMIRHGDGWNTFGNGVIIQYLQGWMIGVWREDWLLLDGFDEDFYPCDFEDVDLSYRAVSNGFELIEVKLPVRHRFGGTTSSLNRLEITKRHKQMFAEKWGLSCM